MNKEIGGYLMPPESREQLYNSLLHSAPVPKWVQDYYNALQKGEVPRIPLIERIKRRIKWLLEDIILWIAKKLDLHIYGPDDLDHY